MDGGKRKGKVARTSVKEISFGLEIEVLGRGEWLLNV